MKKIVEKKWGKEEWIVNNKLYCGKILTCIKGIWSSGGLYHYHKIKDETFYVLSGKVILDINGKEKILKKGDILRIKPNSKHRFKSISPTTKIIEISTQHFDTDSYRVSL